MLAHPSLLKRKKKKNNNNITAALNIFLRPSRMRPLLTLGGALRFNEHPCCSDQVYSFFFFIFKYMQLCKPSLE